MKKKHLFLSFFSFVMVGGAIGSGLFLLSKKCTTPIIDIEKLITTTSMGDIADGSIDNIWSVIKSKNPNIPEDVNLETCDIYLDTTSVRITIKDGDLKYCGEVIVSYELAQTTKTSVYVEGVPYQLTMTNTELADIVSGVSIVSLDLFNFGGPTRPVEREKINAISFITDGSDSTLTAIPSNFINAFENFNSKLILPDSVTTIGNSFLWQTESFNSPLVYPNTITAIGTGFLAECTNFNQPITIPNITIIEDNFLSKCHYFNQPLTLPDTITNIGIGFLTENSSFNFPIILPNNIVEIQRYFMTRCIAFDQPLTLPASLTNIYNGFLSDCNSYDNFIYCPGNSSKPSGWQVWGDMFRGCIAPTNTDNDGNPADAGWGHPNIKWNESQPNP
ncbi:MAG: hypothetical protein Ta2E_07660 [Mycoplasmoidaceae bacterium]|nr:MAG: hypothetical protein Ta2E_07660 [Mycoplasmoidaceae bacterium]